MMTRIEQVLPVHSVVHSTVQVLRFLCRCSVEGTSAVFTLQMLYLLDRCCLTAGVDHEFLCYLTGVALTVSDVLTVLVLCCLIIVQVSMLGVVSTVQVFWGEPG